MATWNPSGNSLYLAGSQLGEATFGNHHPFRFFDYLLHSMHRGSPFRSRSAHRIAIDELPMRPIYPTRLASMERLHNMLSQSSTWRACDKVDVQWQRRCGARERPAEPTDGVGARCMSGGGASIGRVLNGVLVDDRRRVRGARWEGGGPAGWAAFRGFGGLRIPVAGVVVRARLNLTL